MSTYRQIFYHIIFGTKSRERTITEAYCEDLYKYIWGVVKNHNCTLYRINGIEDHIHIFSDLHPSIALAAYIKDIKVSSSLWMKASGVFPNLKGGRMGTVFLPAPLGKRISLLITLNIKKNITRLKVSTMSTSGCW